MSAALELKPKLIVFPIAGKDDVGKRTVMATLAEWYASTAYTADLFGLDPDNKRAFQEPILRHASQGVNKA